MSSRLTRRALFALPVALPVAAVAAKVGVAPVGAERGPLTLTINSSAMRAALAQLERELIWLIAEQRRLTAVLANARVMKIPRREGAADAAKPVTAQAAAPFGERSRGIVDGHEPKCLGALLVGGGEEGTPSSLYAEEQSVIDAGPRDTLALPVVA